MFDPIDEKARARVGSVLDDKWTLERLLGVGGMGAVYEARHRNGARGAVKVLHPDLARNEEVRLRFRREGYAANSVDHPGAVKVLDDEVVKSGPDEGTAYIVMELLEGESLEDRLERGETIGERAFLVILEQVLDVLVAAHAHGVVHRDLKPENLFFARSSDGGPPRVKLLDFGLARLLAGQAITTYGLAVGTPSFMSPEQAAGRVADIDGRTDLFSLAATGFRLTAGRRIHEGDNAVDLVTKMANLPAPKLRDLAPSASAAYARVIDRGLEFLREDRYPTAEAMRQDVRRAIEELQGGERGSTPAPPPARAELPIIELSSSELKSIVLEPAQAEASLPPYLQPQPKPQGKRGRRVLPWVAGALWVAIGVKIVADSHAETGASAPSAGGAVVFDVERAHAPAPPTPVPTVPTTVPSVPGTLVATPSATPPQPTQSSAAPTAPAPVAAPHVPAMPHGPHKPPRNVHHAAKKQHGR